MSETYTESVAGEVRAHVARKNVSQREVAKAIGKSQAAAWRRLSGNYPFNVTELQAIADLLGVPVARFLPDQQPEVAAS